MVDGSISNELGCGRGASAHADDITITVTDETQLPCVEAVIKDDEAVAGAKINKEKPISLQLGTWSGKTISSNVVGQWTDSPVKLLGV